jgi:5-methylcytosine-specific restriction endonuclease McrA
MMISRESAKQVSCPRCSAGVGQPCISKKKIRKSVHKERMTHRSKSSDIPKSFLGFYRSREWVDLRYQAILKYGNRCQCCGNSPADGARIHVDHIKPRSKFPKLELEMSNLQILCQSCNVGKSNRDATDWRGS